MNLLAVSPAVIYVADSEKQYDAYRHRPKVEVLNFQQLADDTCGAASNQCGQRTRGSYSQSISKESRDYG